MMILIKLFDKSMESRPESITEGVIKRRKLRYDGHQTRRGEMAQVLIAGEIGDRGMGRPKRQWADDRKESSGGWTMEKLRRAAKDRQRSRKLVQDWVRPRP